MGEREGVDDALLIAVEQTRNKLRRAAMQAQQASQDSEINAQRIGDGMSQMNRSSERRSR